MPKRRTEPRPRAETMQETRASLIAAALAEFASKGLDASLDGICARAKLTRGAFYVHFEDRDDLILAVMEHVLGGFVDILTGVKPEIGGTERALDLFLAAAKARAPAVHGRKALRFDHLMDACRRSPALGKRYREIVAQARAKIADGIAVDQRAGRLRRVDGVADVLVMFAFGIVAALELDIPIDHARLGATVKELLR